MHWRIMFVKDHRHKTLLTKRKMIYLLAFTMILVSCRPATATQAPTTSAPRTIVESQPIPGGPELLRSGISLRSVAFVDGGSIKLALHPLTGDIYILNPGTGLR